MNDQIPTPSPVAQPLSAAMGAPAGRDYEVFTVPESMPLEQRTITFPETGRHAIIDVTFALLFPAEDRKAYERAGAQAGNPMVVGSCQALEALRFLTIAPIKSTVTAAGDVVETVDLRGKSEVACVMSNGTTEGTWKLMHPAMRGECVVAYMVMSNAPEATTEAFVKSRRRVTR